MEGNAGHIPVLLQETIDGLKLEEGLTVVDCTLGRSGHAKAIGVKLGKTGRLVAIDADAKNVADATEILTSLKCKVILHNENFRNTEKVLKQEGIGEGKVDRFLFDLGLNSLQLETSGRGFSFQVDEPLLMTLVSNPEAETLTARTILNEWSEESLEAVLRGFGGEQFSGRIARTICEDRRNHEINTTFDLVKIIEKAVPNFYKHQKIHCATKTFQAIRIAVNDEFGALKEALATAWKFLASKGRIAIISFHEGEDRIVKNKFLDFKKDNGLIITKKVIAPSIQEEKANPRSRSAKLRVIEKK